MMSVNLNGAVNGIVGESDFYPYGGERVVTADSTNNTYKFTAHERDSETGLDNTLNRKYSSNTGRWLSPDPVHGKPAFPQSWNRYTYVIANPLIFTDPKGSEWYCMDFIGGDPDSGCRTWLDESR
jgi:RHS repeat-associated protein